MEKIKRLAKKSILFGIIVNIGFMIRAAWISVLFVLERRHPISNNKIVCCNTKGKNYGDNPAYVMDAFRAKHSEDFDIVWLLEDSFKGELPEGIRRVTYGSRKSIYELATAKIWLDSNMKPFGTLKRKGQIYIQTWHGSYGVKKICYDMPDKLSFIDKRDINSNSRIEDLFVSNSKAYSEIYRRAMRYPGEILECGSPRNDMFFSQNEKCVEKIHNYFNLFGKHIALYAPTYRDDFEVEALCLDHEKARQALEKRFGGDWVVLVRLHPQNMKSSDSFVSYTDTVINASRYSSMQELLVASDVLITDYSSCMLDFANTRRPCFLFATDIEKYNNSRGFYYDFYDLPFPIATSNEDLERCILDYSEEQYISGINELEKMVGLNENGNACEQVVLYMENKLGE